MLKIIRCELKKEGIHCGIVRCRRRMTDKKQKVNCFLHILPHFLTNSLRNIEHYYRQKFWNNDSNRIVETLKTVNIQSNDRVLIIDDASDTGFTLMHVEKFFRKMYGSAFKMQFAVLTRTGNRLAKEPDFFLFNSTLIRFPWSNDF